MYDIETEVRLNCLKKQHDQKATVVELSNAGSGPGTMMVILHHTLSTLVAVLHPISKPSLA